MECKNFHAFAGCLTTPKFYSQNFWSSDVGLGPIIEPQKHFPEIFACGWSAKSLALAISCYAVSLVCSNDRQRESHACEWAQTSGLLHAHA